ncbi:MAG TPA: DUF6457 domain-containing protein [Actinomycetota bacterium]|nr:DUF6457 domain-containing protein [Actinomycetota bacterium]
MNDWMQDVIDSLAQRTGLDPATLTLSSDEQRTILDVARVAAHSSGARINAPLLCYVLGVAAAQGAPLSATASIVHERDTEQAQ